MAILKVVLWRGWLRFGGKICFYKVLISQDASTLRGILWREIRAILWQLRRVCEEIWLRLQEGLVGNLGMMAWGNLRGN